MSYNTYDPLNPTEYYVGRVLRDSNTDEACLIVGHDNVNGKFIVYDGYNPVYRDIINRYLRKRNTTMDSDTLGDTPERAALLKQIICELDASGYFDGYPVKEFIGIEYNNECLS